MSLHLCDWRAADPLPDVDAMITDPPYSSRTHGGYRSGGDGSISYECIDPDYCKQFVAAWKDRVRGWWVIFGDNQTINWWCESLDDAGLYTFAPVVWVKPDAAPRFRGDGPTSSVEYLAVARPRNTRYAWGGSRPGHYIANTSRAGSGIVGAKPLGLMRAIVRDYTEPGDVVCDPHAGTGTTLRAAQEECRKFVGFEVDASRHALATKRLAAPVQTDITHLRPVQTTIAVW